MNHKNTASRSTPSPHAATNSIWKKCFCSY